MRLVGHWTAGTVVLVCLRRNARRSMDRHRRSLRYDGHCFTVDIPVDNFGDTDCGL